MNKQLLFVLAALCVVAIGAYVFTRGTQKSPTTPSRAGQAPVAPLVKPSFPQAVSRSQPSYRIDAPGQTFPQTVPSVVYANPTSSKPQAIRVAGVLGLGGQPVEIKGNRGVLYTWNENGQSLTFGGDPTELSYTIYQPTQTTIDTRAINADAITTQFMGRVGINVPNLTLTKTKTTLYEPTPSGPRVTTNTATATTLGAGFRYEIDGFPVYTRYPTTPAVSVQIDGEGVLERFNSLWYAGIQKTESVTPVITYDEAARKLLGGEGTLLAFNSDEPQVTDIPEKLSVQTSSVVRAELAYYYTPGTRLLAPVFVFYGRGTDSKTGRAVNTTTVVSALPSQIPQP